MLATDADRVPDGLDLVLFGLSSHSAQPNHALEPRRWGLVRLRFSDFQMMKYCQ